MSGANYCIVVSLAPYFCAEDWFGGTAVTKLSYKYVDDWRGARNKVRILSTTICYTYTYSDFQSSTNGTQSHVQDLTSHHVFSEAYLAQARVST